MASISHKPPSERTEAERAQLLAEREFLSARYPDYKYARHDAYLLQYQQECDAQALRDWMLARGVIVR